VTEVTPSLPDQKSDLEFVIEPEDSQRLSNLCGPCDIHIKHMEQNLGIRIHSRGARFHLSGTSAAICRGESVLRELYQITDKKMINLEQVQTALLYEWQQSLAETGDEIRLHRKTIIGRTPTQLSYMRGIQKYDINFGIGPAGTGKTFLAVAHAVHALEQAQVRRIVLVRPAVEAGEKLGFLPGDLAQKVDPYLRPLFDALYEMVGFEKVARLMERQIIELAPLAYMRGRTLNDSFVLLDEAQNTTIEQMKMFLTRLGHGSQAIITGDITQIDLPRHDCSGLRHAVRVLRGVEGLAFHFFSTEDVVRHPLVQRMLDAYEAEDADQNEHD